MPPLEAWEKVFFDNEAFFETVHASIGCVTCHGGNGEAEAGDMDAAHEGMKATIPMLARKGRASYLGERSIGHQDPGATSSYLLLKTLTETVEAEGQTPFGTSA